MTKKPLASEQIGRAVIDNHYGIGTEWEEPNAYGEEGFTRAQAESDIDADDIRLLIEEGIKKDREEQKLPALEEWITSILESLTTDKNNDWSEELERLRGIRPDLFA